MLSKREILLSVLHHEENMVPSWTMGFTDMHVAGRLLGEENVMTDCVPVEQYRSGSATQENRERNVRYSEAVDNYAIAVGKGSNLAFGHGGPGEFMDRLIDIGAGYQISQYETGVKKLLRTNPHFYSHFNYPAQSLENIESIYVPDANDQGRYDGIEDDVKYYRDRGYFTYANINGFFSGIHYYFYPYDKLFIDMLLDKERLKVLIKKLAMFNLTAAENLLKKGVDCITFCDDLGDGRTLLFSPDLYRELFFRYHCELADLCHSYNAFCHMHSHGNISKIIPDILNTGIDMLNPCDPYEFREMEELKKEIGSRITLVGGINKFYFDWDREQMYEFLKNLIAVGGRNGGYVLMDNGGIPETISKDKFDFYMKISIELRNQYSRYKSI